MSLERPRISIGLPVYNGERYLQRAIDSVLAQTLPDFELIISDNASTDRTAEICRECASRDRRIRYVRHPINVGVTKNFNGVVAHATAPYFKWLSADDLIAPDLLRRCAGVLDRDPSVVLVHSTTRFIGPDGEWLPQEESGLHLVEDRPTDRLRSLWQKLRFCNAQYGVMRVAALRRTPLFRPFIGSDICFLAELSLHGRFVELPETLLFRRLHGDAASSLSPEQLMTHYGLERGTLVLYYWRHLAESVMSAWRAPIDTTEKLRALHLVVKRAIWQRHLLRAEIGFLIRHLTGRPYPLLPAAKSSDNRGPGV